MTHTTRTAAIAFVAALAAGCASSEPRTGGGSAAMPPDSGALNADANVSAARPLQPYTAPLYWQGPVTQAR